MSRSISQAPHPGELGKAPTTFLAKKPHDKPNGFLPSSDVSDKTTVRRTIIDRRHVCSPDKGLQRKARTRRSDAYRRGMPLQSAGQAGQHRRQGFPRIAQHEQA